MVDLSSYINDFGEDLVRKLSAKIEAMIEEARLMTVKEFLKMQVAEDIKDFARSAASTFYGSYGPEFYNRKESMSSDGFFTAEIHDDTKFKYEFHPEAMSSYRKKRNPRDGSGGLYKQVFVNGWHGGGYNSPWGDPGYRGPIKRWSHWTRPAIQSEAPLSIFEKLKKEYEKNPPNDVFNSLLVKNINLIRGKYNF